MVRNSFHAVLALALAGLLESPAPAADGGAWVAGSVFMTRQNPTGGFLRAPLPGFRVALITAAGEVGSALSDGAGAFLLEVPAGERFHLRCEAPPDFPVPFLPSLSQYFTLETGEIASTEIPMAAAILAQLLPKITFPSTGLGPDEGVIEGIFEDERGVRIRGATLRAEGYEGPTYSMSDHFPLMFADPPETQGPGAALLLNVPAAAEVICHGDSDVPGAAGTAAVPVEPGALTNVLFSALHDQGGVPVGPPATGAAVGTILHASAGGPTLLTLVAPEVAHGLQVTFANDGGAFLLTGLPAGEEVTLTLAAPGYAAATTEPFTVPAGGAVLLPPTWMTAVFRRGDGNGDGAVELADAVKTLDYLFLGDRAVPCADAMDANDDGKVDIADPVYTLLFIFADGAPIPAPNDCGPDPTADAAGELGCETYPVCP